MRNEKGQFVKGISPHNKNKKKKFNLNEINRLHWEEGKSILEISKELGVSDRLIRLRLKENGFDIRSKTKPSSRIKNKIKSSMIRNKIEPKIKNNIAWNKGIPASEEVRNRLIENRSKQIFPVKDSSIENKIKSFLNKLNLQFEQHKVINIKNQYQCDIFIPEQEGIKQKTIIECDGCYWHGCPTCNLELNKKQINQRDKDNLRNKQIKGKNIRIIRLWEHDIKGFKLEDFKKLIDI